MQVDSSDRFIKKVGQIAGVGGDGNKKDLNDIGINQGTIFPDLDNQSLQIKKTWLPGG